MRMTNEGDRILERSSDSTCLTTINPRTWTSSFRWPRNLRLWPVRARDRMERCIPQCRRVRLRRDSQVWRRLALPYNTRHEPTINCSRITACPYSGEVGRSRATSDVHGLTDFGRDPRVALPRPAFTEAMADHRSLICQRSLRHRQQSIRP